jgi:D-alanine-D-alanine ligase
MNLATLGYRVFGPGRPWWEYFVRRKGHIGPLGLWLLAIVACLPLLMVLARVAALPGVNLPGAFGGEVLRVIGSALNRSVSLEWVPPEDRRAILYILLLPTAALLIALARLTFGLRVLGFRSILIAVGFQEIGIVPSLLLMVIVVGIILAMRPPMQRIQLTFYARTSVILCIAAVIMVAGLLLGPSLRSETLWSFAFFPVIILAMLAEGVAGTIARDDAWTAAWRAASTILLAFVIAFVSWIPAVREAALRFPELMLTQLVAVVFISEFLDFRIFETLPARFAGKLREIFPDRPGPLRVAVVRNRSATSVIGRLGLAASPASRTQSSQVIIDALLGQGFTVQAFEGDMSLLHGLHGFLPTDPVTGAPGGIVLNLAAGFQGQGRSCHLPAMLEMAGVAYTGPDPIVHARLLDRYALMTLLRKAGIPTPRFRLLARASDDIGDLRFPLVARPRYEPDAGRIVVEDREALVKAVRRIARVFAQDALVESLEKGREIRFSLLGNDPIECLPLLEVAGDSRTCPAAIDDALAERVRDCARDAYIAVGCRDYARIDIRLTAAGKPQVIGVHAVGLFARKGSFAQSAEAAGYAFDELMRRVVEVAWKRYGVEPVLRLPSKTAGKPKITLLDKPAPAGSDAA